MPSGNGSDSHTCGNGEPAGAFGSARWASKEFGQKDVIRDATTLPLEFRTVTRMNRRRPARRRGRPEHPLGKEIHVSSS
jgi:hypothetical protein